MRFNIKRTVFALVSVFILDVLGFVFFYLNFPAESDRFSIHDVDAVVVFTGGSNRIESVINLISDGLHVPTLITGVHPSVSEESLLKDLTERERGDVDIDYQAQTTRDNVDVTLKWMHKKNVNNLGLVTSHYHIPRSLMLFKQANYLDEVHVYPVIPSNASLPFLFREYHKFLLASVRVI